MQQTKDQGKQAQKFITMTQTPVKKLIMKLAIPTMISMMITSIYNMADTFFVGQITGGEATSATAAVGVAFPLMAIIQAFGFMFGHGSGNYISRALGKQELGNAEKMAATGFFMAAHLAVDLCKLGLTVCTKVLVAEALHNLEVTVETGYHQQLLEELRALRQSIELAGIHARGNNEVACALGCRSNEHRGLDLDEVH